MSLYMTCTLVCWFSLFPYWLWQASCLSSLPSSTNVFVLKIITVSQAPGVTIEMLNVSENMEEWQMDTQNAALNNRHQEITKLVAMILTIYWVTILFHEKNGVAWQEIRYLLYHFLCTEFSAYLYWWLWYLISTIHFSLNINSTALPVILYMLLSSAMHQFFPNHHKTGSVEMCSLHFTRRVYCMYWFSIF